MRTKSGVVSHRKRVKVRKGTKGMQRARRTSYRLGKQAITRSLEYSYRDRRTRKRDFKRLWIQRINAAARANGTTYAKFMNDLSKAGSTINRKMLAELAYSEPEAFKAVLQAVSQPKQEAKVQKQEVRSTKQATKVVSPK